MTFMTDESSETPRRRQTSAEAMAGREAAVLVRDLNRRLGSWQAASVKVHTMAQRLKAAGREDPSVEEEAQMLLHALSVELGRFEAMLLGQSERVASHGRVNDTRRSFEMVGERLRATLQLLGSHPKAE
jgi:hypothetical protein